MSDSDANTNTNVYQSALRRILIDMHIPDWDDGFLDKFDPELAARSAVDSGANGVMMYFQSHVGLCNWPTKTGVQHAKFKGGDPMEPLVNTLKHHGVGVCAYYSTIFNTWAHNQHPEWRIKPAAPAVMGPLPMARYGLCCPNNPDYRQFVHEQAKEIVAGYNIDTMFFDMVWWPAICICPHCEERCERELGASIPKTIDWHDPLWCAFQAAREDWITEFAMELKKLTHAARPGTLVYHNFALSMSNWSKGVSFKSTYAHDFLGGDFYGGRYEQLVISKLMLNLSQTHPVEFMTTVARNLVDHEQLQSSNDLHTQTYGALGCRSAFLMIAAVDPDGQTNPAMIERIGNVYEETSSYEPFIGGHPIEDIAVYFSDASKMNFSDNGKALKDMSCGATPDYPHFEAVKGACKKLAAAHLPFGVITQQKLDRLADYKVIILPNVLRMHEDEVTAFKEYVKGGGKLYASRLTSLTSADGTRKNNFALSEVFGCNFEDEDQGRICYARPSGQLVKQALHPERFLGHRDSINELTGSVRITSANGTPLAKLSLPYGHPQTGTTKDKKWSSIHSDPPWEHLDDPVIVSNSYGKGRVIYSASDIEAGDSDGCKNVFTALIKDLLGEKPSFIAETYQSVWMNAFNQNANNQIIVSFLNYQLETPNIPIKRIQFKIMPPKGAKIKSVKRLPHQNNIAFETLDDGQVLANLDDLETFAMCALEYE